MNVRPAGTTAPVRRKRLPLEAGIAGDRSCTQAGPQPRGSDSENGCESPFGERPFTTRLVPKAGVDRRLGELIADDGSRVTPLR